MPSRTVSGSPRARLISAARFLTLSCRAISSRPAASIEIGNAAARTSRSPTRTVAPRVGQAGRPAAGPQEVRGVGPALEAQQVRAEQAVDDLTAPRQLGEDLVAGERDVVEEADPDVAALLADHLRDQLELVVVHPDRRPGRRLVHGGLRERPVDRHVGVPPPAMELGRGDDVVIQRPQRRVAEPLVVVPDLLRGQAHAHQVQAVHLEGPGRGPRVAGPADPHAPRLAHDRFQRADQPARTGPPLCLAVRALGPVHRQPAGHHHEPMTPVRLTVSRLPHRRHHLNLMRAIGRLGNRLLSSYSRQHER